MKYSGEEKKIDLSPISIVRTILLFLIPITAYAIGIFPPLLIIYFSIKFLELSNPFQLLLFSFILIIDYLILIFSMIFSSAFFINAFDLKYKEGDYRKTISNMHYIIPFYLRLIGAKIGKNVFFGW